MRGIKVALMMILLFFLVAAAYQNRDFLLETESLAIDLLAFHYETPKLHIGMMFSACFLVGMLLSYFFTLLSKYKSSRTIKLLNQIKTEQMEQIATLEARLAALQSNPQPPNEHGEDLEST